MFYSFLRGQMCGRGTVARVLNYTCLSSQIVSRSSEGQIPFSFPFLPWSPRQQGLTILKPPLQPSPSQPSRYLSCIVTGMRVVNNPLPLAPEWYDPPFISWRGWEVPRSKRGVASGNLLCVGDENIAWYTCTGS